jgi:hypothetical protein
VIWSCRKQFLLWDIVPSWKEFGFPHIGLSVESDFAKPERWSTVAEMEAIQAAARTHPEGGNAKR